MLGLSSVSSGARISATLKETACRDHRGVERGNPSKLYKGAKRDNISKFPTPKIDSFFQHEPAS